MKNRLFLIFIFTINAFGLDINEAVNLALKNSNSIKIKEFDINIANQNRELIKSNFEPSIFLNYNYNLRDEPISQQRQLNSDSTLSIISSYNLFNGFKDKYNLEASEYLKLFYEFELKAYKQDIILNTKISYINLLSAKRDIIIQQEALSLLNAQLNDAKNFYTNGLIDKSELLEVEVAMLNAKQLLSAAKSRQKIAKESLKKLIGEEFEELVDLKEEIEKFEIDEKKLSNRSEIKSLLAYKTSLQKTKNSKKYLYYPAIDLSVSYNRYGDDFIPNKRDNYPSSQIIGQVSLKWSLYAGDYLKNNLLLSTYEINKVDEQIKDLKKELKLQLVTAIEEFNLSTENIKVASLALTYAKENFKIKQNRLKEGIAKNSDLLDARYLLSKSKESYFKEFYNLFLAKAKLERVLEED